MTGDQDRRISEAVEQQRARLRNFIRSRVPDPSDAEDILQDVFFELVAAYRLMKPVEQVGAWLFRVARNRIIDRFRKRKPETVRLGESKAEEGALSLEELLPSSDASPEAAFVRNVLMDEIGEALAELPPEQREVFIANEIEGHTFAEIAQETGTSINTLLSRKRYAVLHLRRHLREVYQEFDKEE
ncbi:MAG: RNA polymerase subunit sigma-24 [Acidobacteria bacterium]|nr:MAG: RNA polymerase subunit sigma-24 [Acidobacteriota bacterium]PYV65347.1 MAG: RNA polymerase subunit sigma-24 [Acidobacteriota bacterium]PYV68122.1 MAG: RNA polymerase subunit sigma-24 [Acidobacteriota bacterium]